MGLLDFANTDDGMQGLGLLGAAAPSMAPMNLAGRIAQAVQGYQGLRKDALQNKLLTLQEMRAQQQFEMQKDAYYGSPDGSGGGSAPLTAMGGAMPPQMATMGYAASPRDMLSGDPVPRSPQMPESQQSAPAQPMAQQPNIGAQLDRLGRMALAGIPGAKEQLDILKYRNEPQTLAPGILRNPVTGQIMTLPTTSANGTSSMPVYNPATGEFSITAPKGAVDTARSYSDALKDNDIIKVPDGSGGTKDMLMKDYRAILQGNGAPSPASAPAAQGGDSSAQFVVGKDGVPISAQDLMRRIAQIPDPKQRMESTRIMQEYLGQQKQAPQAAMPASAAPSMSGILGFTPSAAQLEADKTAAVAGVKLSTEPAIKSATDIAGGDAKNFSEYKNSLNKSVELGYQQYMRNQTIEQLMQSYQTGLPNPEARSAFASGLKNMFPNNPGIKAFAESVNGGNIGSGQMLANLLSSAGLTNVIKTLDGNGRINKAEFQALQEHAEQNRSDPDALLGIMHYQNNAFKQDYAEQQALAKAEKEGAISPKTWQADYLKMRMDNLATPGALPQTPAQASGKPPASSLTDQLPTANKSNMGKIAIDHDTGKKYRSNGLQWQEVK